MQCAYVLTVGRSWSFEIIKNEGKVTSFQAAFSARQSADLSHNMVPFYKNSKLVLCCLFISFLVAIMLVISHKPPTAYGTYSSLNDIPKEALTSRNDPWLRSMFLWKKCQELNETQTEDLSKVVVPKHVQFIPGYQVAFCLVPKCGLSSLNLYQSVSCIILCI